MKLLALGDVVGAYGTRETAALLPRLRRETGADFVVVNAENAAPGNGTDPASAELLLASGADVLTGGNHTLRRYDFFDMLNEHDCVLRPLNYPPAAPGKGFTILRGPEGLRILVLSLCGQVFMGPADNPFTAAERLLAEQRGRYDIAVADLHAEATSEKLAFAHRFDGEIQIVTDESGKLVWECPKCGNRDENKLNVARRTCGYIGTQFWNQGRTQEIKERVLHL